MKKYLLLLFLVTMIGILAACNGESTATTGKESTENKATKVRLALDTAATGSSQSRVANAEGVFEENGIKAEISDFAWGIDTLNAILIGQADVGSAADYALLNSLTKGDLVIVGTLSRSTEETVKDNLLFVNDNVKNAKDLKGKKLGVPQATVTEYVWAKYLEKIGLEKDDVQFVNYTTMDEAIVAVNRKSIDAIWASGALKDRLEKIDVVRPTVDSSATGVFIKSFLVVNRSFLDENRDAVSRLLKSLAESTEIVKSNPEKTADILFNNIKLPKEGVLADLKYSNYVVGFTQEDYEHLEDMKQWLIDQKLLTEDYDLASKIDIEPLKKALPDSVTYKK